MKKTILITFFFSYYCFAQFQGFQTTFTFSEFSIHSQDLVLGYDPFGTDGLDPNLGETIVPQVPPNTFGVRCQLPSDTSLYTLKDIRFGCGQPFYFEYLIDLSYYVGIMQVDWDWEWPMQKIDFINPNNGQTLATFNAFFDSSYYDLLTLDKIIIGIQFDGPLSWPTFQILSPNGGETLISGENFLITWTNSFLPPQNLWYSSNAGNNWSLLTDSIPYPYNNFLWQVPQLNSDSCLVRVGRYPCAYDVSNNFFLITYPVNAQTEKHSPTKFSLEQNYPNPFNPSTKIKYEIPDQVRNDSRLVSLKVFDLLGDEVATLVNEEKQGGVYEVEFDASNLPSGIYFYQLIAESSIKTRKMVLMK